MWGGKLEALLVVHILTWCCHHFVSRQFML